MFREVFDQFVKESPVSVMVRATLEQTRTAEFLDSLFREYSGAAARESAAVLDDRQSSPPVDRR